MAIERGETTAGNEAKAVKAHKFLGSLRDALMAAGRDDAPVEAAASAPPAPACFIGGARCLRRCLRSKASAPKKPRAWREHPLPKLRKQNRWPPPKTKTPTFRRRRASFGPKAGRKRPRNPRTRRAPYSSAAASKIERGVFERDPVVGFLIIVGGPGLGSFRPIFEGNNTVGRSTENRIPLDFGDDAISNEAQAYLRYDSSDQSFLFVPNLAKTNVVSVNDKRPTGPVPLQSMDVITLGRTQVAFLPFCGSEFDWSEISEA